MWLRHLWLREGLGDGWGHLDWWLLHHWELPLCLLRRKVDVVVLARGGVQVRDPALGRLRRRGRTAVDGGGLEAGRLLLLLLLLRLLLLLLLLNLLGLLLLLPTRPRHPHLVTHMLLWRIGIIRQRLCALLLLLLLLLLLSLLLGLLGLQCLNSSYIPRSKRSVRKRWMSSIMRRQLRVNIRRRPASSQNHRMLFIREALSRSARAGCAAGRKRSIGRWGFILDVDLLKVLLQSRIRRGHGRGHRSLARRVGVDCESRALVDGGRGMRRASRRLGRCPGALRRLWCPARLTRTRCSRPRCWAGARSWAGSGASQRCGTCSWIPLRLLLLLSRPTRAQANHRCLLRSCRRRFRWRRGSPMCHCRRDTQRTLPIIPSPHRRPVLLMIFREWIQYILSSSRRALLSLWCRCSSRTSSELGHPRRAICIPPLEGRRRGVGIRMCDRDVSARDCACSANRACARGRGGGEVVLWVWSLGLLSSVLR